MKSDHKDKEWSHSGSLELVVISLTEMFPVLNEFTGNSCGFNQLGVWKDCWHWLEYASVKRWWLLLRIKMEVSQCGYHYPTTD